MKANARDFDKATPITTELMAKVNETFLGSLPKECGIYILPLFCQKSVNIKGKDRDVVYSPFIVVKDAKIVSVELRPSSGLRQSVVSKVNEANSPIERISKYANFDNTLSLVECIKQCYATPLTFDKAIKVVKVDFIDDKPVYNPTDLVDVNTYKFATVPKFKLSSEELLNQYEETLIEWIDNNLCTDEDAKNWLS